MKRYLPLLLAALWLVPEATAQTADDALRYTRRSPATGTRMLGMAGAGTAGLADFGAVYANPAGLGYFTSSSVTGSFSLTSVSDDAVYSLGGADTPFDNTLNQPGLGHFAYVGKAPTRRGSLVLAASLSQVHSWERELAFDAPNGRNSITEFFLPIRGEYSFDRNGDPVFDRTLSFIAFETFAIDWDPACEDAPEACDQPFLSAAFGGATELQQTGRVLEEGAMREVNLGGAVEMAPGLMAGLNVTVPFGQYRFTRVFEEIDALDQNDGSGGTTDFDYVLFSESLESDMVGIGLRAGLSAAIGEFARAGLTIETPTYFAVEDAYSTRLETGFDNGEVYTYGDDFDEDAGAGGFDYRLTSPWRIAVGGAVQAQGLRLLGDLEWVDWSQLALDADDFDYTPENDDIRTGLEAVVNLRVGAEFDLADFTLRTGVAYQPDPYASLGADVEALERDHTFLSAGFSYRFQNNVAFDFGWMQEQFDDEYSPYGLVGAPVVRENVKRNLFSAGLRVGF